MCSTSPFLLESTHKLDHDKRFGNHDEQEKTLPYKKAEIKVLIWERSQCSLRTCFYFSVGGTQLDLAIFYNPVRLLATGLKQQHSHRAFNLQIVQSERRAEVMVTQSLWEWSTHEWSNLWPLPCEGDQL